MTTDQALQHLTPRQIQLIQLRDSEKRKWNDVASAMGISLNYAMKLHKEAKAELSRLMALDETKLFKPRALAGPWGFEAEPSAPTPPDPIPAPMEAISEPPPAKPKVVVAQGVPQKVVWVHGVIVPQPPPEPPRRWSSVTIQS